MKIARQSVGHPVDVASGEMYVDQKDISIDGKFELFWDRHYGTSLAQNETCPLGPGWYSTLLMTLTRTPVGYRLINEEGAEIEFTDPEGRVENGGVVRNLSAFRELRRRGGDYVVTRWVADEVDVELFVFAPGRNDRPWPLTAIEDATGQGLDLQYDAGGLLRRIHQRIHGRSLHLEYSSDGRISTITVHCDGIRPETLVRYEYDQRGRLIKSVDAMEYANSYSYDEYGRIIREVAKDGGVFSFRYDEEGRCVWTAGIDNYDAKRLRYRDNIGWTDVTDSTGAVTRYQWNSNGQVVLTLNPLGGQATTEFDDYGRIVAQTNETGALTAIEYDDHGNCRKITLPDGTAVSREFNEAHLPIRLIDEAGNVWSWEHDSHNRVSATVNPLGEKTSYLYDAQGNVQEIVSPDGARKRQGFSPTGDLAWTTDFEGRITRYQADALRRSIVVTDPVGAQTHYRHDRLGRLTSMTFPSGARKSWEYNPVGLVTKVTDELSRVTRFRFGPCRRLLERIDPLGNRVRYHWGTEPKRLQAIENEKGEIYSFDFDAEGRIVHERSFDGREMWFEYDPAGNVVGTRTDDVNVTRMERNATGRVEKITLPDGAVHQFEYSELGDVLKAQSPDCTVEFTRNKLGDILKVVQGRFEIGTPHDSGPAVRTLKTSLGLDAAFAYDSNGQLRELAIAGRPVVRCVRDAADRESGVYFSGNVGLQKAYDVVGHLSEQRLSRGALSMARASAGAFEPAAQSAGMVLSRGFERDLAGHVEVMRDSERGEFRYTYDAADRVRVVARDRGDSESYDYDACDNITSMSRGASQRNLAYQTGNRLVSAGAATYTYDQLGRLVSKKVSDGSSVIREWKFTWDWLDRLRSATTPEGDLWKYRYDAFGRRIAKEGPNDLFEFLWDGDRITQIVHNGQLESTWLFATDGPHQPLLGIINDEMHLVVTDHLGTPREMVDSSGQVRWSAAHTVWGAIEHETSSGVRCPIRFPGQWFDEETGFCYNYFRYYDPDLGRYISPDPIGPDGGNNLYAYVTNPMDWVDVYGWVHGNDASNGNPQHVYEIKDNQTGETFKYGISGQPLNQDGSSPRANTQVNALNNDPAAAKEKTGVPTSKEFLPEEKGGGGKERFTAKIVKKDIQGDANTKARQKALDLEQKKVDAFANKKANNGEGPKGNKRPQPTKKKGC